MGKERVLRPSPFFVMPGTGGKRGPVLLRLCAGNGDGAPVSLCSAWPGRPGREPRRQAGKAPSRRQTMAGEGREACAALPGSGEQRAVSSVDRDDGKQERRRHIMRVMMVLVLGLYLALPARAADSGPVLLLPGASGPAAETIAGYRCCRFFGRAGLKPEGLEYFVAAVLAGEPRTGRRHAHGPVSCAGAAGRCRGTRLAGAHRHGCAGTSDGYLAAAGRRGRTVRPEADRRGGQYRCGAAGPVFIGRRAAGRPFRS